MDRMVEEGHSQNHTNSEELEDASWSIRLIVLTQVSFDPTEKYRCGHASDQTEDVT